MARKNVRLMLNSQREAILDEGIDYNIGWAINPQQALRGGAEVLTAWNCGSIGAKNMDIVLTQAAACNLRQSIC